MIPRVPGEGLEQAIFACSLVLEKGSGNSEIECLMEEVSDWASGSWSASVRLTNVSPLPSLGVR